MKKFLFAICLIKSLICTGQNCQPKVSGNFDFINLAPMEGDTNVYFFMTTYDSLCRIEKIRRYDKKEKLFNLELNIIVNNDSLLVMYPIIYYGSHNDDLYKASPLRGHFQLLKKEKKLFYLATRDVHPYLYPKSTQNIDIEILAIFSLRHDLYPIIKLDLNCITPYKTIYNYNKKGQVENEKMYLLDAHINPRNFKENTSYKKYFPNYSPCGSLAKIVPRRKNLNIPMWIVFPYMYD